MIASDDGKQFNVCHLRSCVLTFENDVMVDGGGAHYCCSVLLEGNGVR